MDLKEIINIIFQTMQMLGKDHEFGKDVTKLVDKANSRDLKPFDTAIRTNSTEYKNLHQALDSVKKGGWLSLDRGYKNVVASASMAMPRLT